MGFRPSETVRQAIETLVKEKKAKNVSDAVNQLLEKTLQLEQKKQLEEEFFQYPPFLYCPETGWLIKETLLDPNTEGNCQKCRAKKSCRAWKG